LINTIAIENYHPIAATDRHVDYDIAAAHLLFYRVRTRYFVSITTETQEGTQRVRIVDLEALNPLLIIDALLELVQVREEQRLAEALSRYRELYLGTEKRT